MKLYIRQTDFPNQPTITWRNTQR